MSGRAMTDRPCFVCQMAWHARPDGVSLTDPRLLTSAVLGVTVMWHRPCAPRLARSRPRTPGPRGKVGTARRCTPHAEALEGRTLLSNISEYPLASDSAVPVAIAQGPGGQMWFLDQGSNLIASMDPVTHAVHATAIPTAAAYATSLAVDPAGRIWFTEERVGRLGVLDPTTGIIREFATPSVNSDPYGITTGPDGNLWFTELGAGKIGKIDPTTGVI